MATFGINNATDHQIWNMASLFLLTLKALDTMLNYGSQFFKIKVSLHILYRCNKFGDLYHCISDTSNALRTSLRVHPTSFPTIKGSTQLHQSTQFVFRTKTVFWKILSDFQRFDLSSKCNISQFSFDLNKKTAAAILPLKYICGIFHNYKASMPTLPDCTGVSQVQTESPGLPCQSPNLLDNVKESA